jgi:hypothetical protein
MGDWGSHGARGEDWDLVGVGKGGVEWVGDQDSLVGNTVRPRSEGEGEGEGAGRVGPARSSALGGWS